MDIGELWEDKTLIQSWCKCLSKIFMNLKFLNNSAVGASKGTLRIKRTAFFLQPPDFVHTLDRRIAPDRQTIIYSGQNKRVIEQ